MKVVFCLQLKTSNTFLKKKEFSSRNTHLPPVPKSILHDAV